MKKLTQLLIKEKIIVSKEIELIEYGFRAITLNLLTVCSIILASFIINEIFIGLLFLIFFIPLRINLGGYHCKTPLNCISCFTFLYIMIFYISEHVLNIHILYSLLVVLLFTKSYRSMNKGYIDVNSKNNFKNIIIFIFILLVFFTNSSIIYQVIFMVATLNILLIYLAYLSDKYRVNHN